MLSIGLLSFAAPMALAGFAALAVIWWFLRLKPPAPVRIAYPAVRILAGLQQEQESPAKTPLWLLVLRLLLASVVIMAAAHPLWDAGKPFANQGPVFLIIDDGWSAAPDWRARKTMMLGVVDRAEREGRSVVVLPTAPFPSGTARDDVGLLSADEARRRINSLQPKPWPVDRGPAVERLSASNARQNVRPGDVIWFSNGLQGAESDLAELTKQLVRMGSTSVVTSEPGRLPVLLRAPSYDNATLTAPAERASPVGAQSVTVRAMDAEGVILARQPLLFKDGDPRGEARIPLPSELFNKIERLEIEEFPSVGGVVLMDERWRRRPVGLLSASGAESVQPLLSSSHYLERALEPFTEIRKGSVEGLLQRPLAVMVLAGQDRVSTAEQAMLTQWLENGGVLIRFAGPGLSDARGPVDPLLPVKLRSGDRVIGGVMSWSKPARLAPFTEDSPFFGLSVSEDVRVQRQVLARPSPDLVRKTWAKLSDGTPLLTAEKRGNGWTVLVHTAATPEWSNLPISGLFVEMLRKIVELSQGVSGDLEGASLSPVTVLDGFARPVQPGGAVRPVALSAFTDLDVSPSHPPGFYGHRSIRQAHNLSTKADPPMMLGPLPDAVDLRYYSDGRELDLKPWMLVLAFALFIIDAIASLAIRGLIPLGRAVAGGVAVLVAVASAGEGLAQDTAFARENSLETRLAYVLTGDDELDRVSEMGLSGLTSILAQRTAAELGPPQGVDPASDDLSFFPLLYWPIPDNFSRPDNLATERIKDYMRNGGTVLFDTRAVSGGRVLRELARDIGLPRLVPVPDGHVLSRAFYLLKSYPGRWSGSTLWVEPAGERVNDGVSPVIVGAHDWAGAWAIDEGGRPVFPVVPGGERQRELAYRFGVNLVMYTLTGNYKADQVHLPAIMERLGQ